MGNEESNPAGEMETKCTCEPLFTGQNCGVRCPTDVPDTVCSGHGKCEDPEDESTTGGCKCDAGFKGNHCGFECPKGENGELCSGNGECTVDTVESKAKCECNENFSG